MRVFHSLLESAYNLGMDDEVLKTISTTFPTNYAVVAERVTTASERVKTEDYTNILRKQETLSEYAIFVGYSPIDDVLNQGKKWHEGKAGFNATWEVSVISYERSLENPMFLYVLNRETSIPNKDITDAATFTKELFEKIVQGDVSPAQFHDIKNQYDAVTTLKIKKNNLLVKLDNGYENGVFQTDIIFDNNKDSEQFTSDIFDLVEPEVYVDIKVAGSWLALFLDEIDIILQRLKLCDNCKKPLPPGYKGRFCPPENKDCVLERQRLRKATERDKAEYRRKLRSHK